MSALNEPRSISDILISIAKDADIDPTIYKEYIRKHKVHREQVGDNINMEEEIVPSNAEEPEDKFNREPLVRMGTSLQVHEDYFEWTEQTRITCNKDLQAHAHSNERKAKRKLDIEGTACRRARDALEREQSRLLGREAQFGNQLWAHVRQEGEHRRAFDQCVSKSAMFKQIAEHASEVELVTCTVLGRLRSSDLWTPTLLTLKDGLLLWKFCDNKSSFAEVKMDLLQRVVAYPPYTAVASSGVLFASCRAEPLSGTAGRCYGREVIELDWGEGKLEIAPMFEEEEKQHTSLDLSNTSTSLNDNDEGAWPCQLCDHMNKNVSGAGKCESCLLISPPPPPPPPPPSSRPKQRGRDKGGQFTQRDQNISENFEAFVSSLEFLLNVRFDQQLPILGLLVDCPSALKGNYNTSRFGARRKALSSREAVCITLSIEGRTSSEASSLPSSPSATSTVSWSPGMLDQEHNNIASESKQPRSVSEAVDHRLGQLVGKLGIVDNARYQVRCANLERTEAQAAILRSVSRREKTLELLAALKQLQDMCRRPPGKGKNGKWQGLPPKRSAVLSEVGRRLSQALETTSIPDLWASSTMSSWPPIQNMHQQAVPVELGSPEEKGVKGRGSMSSVEVLRRKKRSAAEKRRQSHVRFLRNGVDDFAVEPSKLRVCSLIYEYQSQDAESHSSEGTREHAELAKEFERMKELISAFWEQQEKFMGIAHELARERALLYWYIYSGHVLRGEEDMTPSYSLASSSGCDFANPELFSNPSFSISSFHSPNPSFCEDEWISHTKSLSNISEVRLFHSASLVDKMRPVEAGTSPIIGSPILEPKTLKFGEFSLTKDQTETPAIDELGSRPTSCSLLDNKDSEEMFDVDF